MKRLPPQDWMSDPDAGAVLDALEAAGGPDCARFVGGCVRNALMGKPVADVDIATRLEPAQVIAALEAAGIRAVPTGVEHGTVTAISGHKPFEVTTLRRDVETDGRRAVVAFTDDWAEDAQRRDFRLNALYADRAGAVFDPVGGGVEDALAGRIVFVGEAEARIREDYLRILRFFRFHAWYGRTELDAAGLQACARLKDGIAKLSAERISSELLKLLAAPDPRAAIELMVETGVMAEILPGGVRLKRLHAMVEIDADPVLRLSTLLPDNPVALGGVADGLRLSGAQRERLLEALPDLSVMGNDAAVRATLYRLGPQAFADQVKRAWASGRLEAERARKLVAMAEGWVRPRFGIGGAEVIAAGVPMGPKVGRVLRDLELWWIENNFTDDGLETRLAELIAEQP